MGYSPAHTGRHHAKSHMWYDEWCKGCQEMTEEQEQEARDKEMRIHQEFLEGRYGPTC
jgi:hypothetical protein